MFWWQHVPVIQIPMVPAEIVYDEKEEPPIIQEFPVELTVAPQSKPEEERVREYCSSCMTPEGEIKCPRRHRCKTCHCYMTDEEWFAQK